MAGSPTAWPFLLLILSLWTMPVSAAAPPLVDSFVASPASVAPGGSTTLTVNAHDPDCLTPPCTSGCGQYVSATLTTWSASGGTLSTTPNNGSSASPYTASTTWQAPVTTGTYTVTVSISDSGTFMCGNRQTTTATTSITVATAPPVIDSFTVTPGVVATGGTALLAVTAHDPLARPMTYAFSAPAGTIQQVDPSTPQAQWTAPMVGGPVVLTATVTAGTDSVSSTVTAQVVIGTFLGWLPGSYFATRVAALPNGGMAVVDALHGTVEVRDAAGSHGWRATGLTQPIGAAPVGSELYVVERGTRDLAVLGVDGSRSRTLMLPAGIALPNDIAAGPNAGEISVSDESTARIWVLSTANASFLRTIGDGTLVFPAAVSGYGGKLAVADANQRRVITFDALGTVLSTLVSDSTFVRTQGVVWDGANNQFVIVDVFTGELTVMNGAGATTGVMGGWVSGDQNLQNPNSVALVGGNVVAVSVAATGQVALYRLYTASPRPSAVVTSLSAVCPGSTGNVASVPDAGAGATYAWSVTNGTITAGDGTRQVTFTAGAPGAVTLNVVVTNGGSSVGTQVIAAQQPAAPVALSNGPVCAGGTIQLTASGPTGGAYQWTGPNGYLSTAQNPILVNVTGAMAGTYAVTVAVNGCSSPPATTTVAVLAAPAAPAITAPSSVGAGAANLVASVSPAAGSTWSWSISGGTISSGQGTNQITFTAGTPGSLSLSVVETSSAGCSSPVGSVTLSVVRAEADVAIAMTVDNPVPTPGQNVTFTITAKNTGPQNATAVIVTSDLPAGLALISWSPALGTYDPATGTWTIGTLANGLSASLQLTAGVSAAGSIVASAARTSANEVDPDFSNNVASIGLNAVALADVQLHQTVDVAAPGVGASVTFTVTVRNAGPSGATNVILNEALPAGVAFVSATTSQGTYVPATGVWTVGAVPSGTVATLQIQTTVSAAGTQTAVATKTQTEQDPQATNDSASATINATADADLAIAMTAAPEPATAGAPISWTIVVSNLGPVASSNATVTGTVPLASLTSVTASASQGGGCVIGTSVTCNLGSIPAGSSAVITIDALNVSGGALPASAVVSGDQNDPYLPNNSTFTATTPVELLRFEVE